MLPAMADSRPATSGPSDVGEMRLRDFEIVAGPGFSDDRSREREVNRLAKAVSEEVRYALSSRPPVNAPFAKLIVALVNTDTVAEFGNRRVRPMLDVIEVSTGVTEADLQGDRGHRNESLLDATEAALQLTENELVWSSTEMHEIVRELRGRLARLGLIELGSFSRTDRKTGRKASVFYVVADDVTAIDVVVTGSDGTEVRRERVAESQLMLWPERFFPLHSAILKDGVFVLRDRSREPLAAVVLRDVIDMPRSEA